MCQAGYRNSESCAQRRGQVLLVHCAVAALWTALITWCPAQTPAPVVVVNGEPIPEKDLQRALDRLPLEHRQRARQEILERLIDNLLIDQHLLSLQIPAPPDEIEARLRQIQEEVKRSGQDYQKLLQELALTEAELKRQIAAELRWERYLQSQIPDAALQKFFQEHREWFNGSAVQARHILVACPAQADPTQKKQAQQKAEELRQHILAEVEKRLAQTRTASNEEKETLRQRLLVEVFAETAIKHSECPSKTRGGDLGWFPRIGVMVEPFAAAAFATPVGQVSPPVETPFGYHLILVTGKQPGREVKFEDVKDEVREVQGERLRQELLRQLRSKARIEFPNR
jgi:peptidyl-prolyl cis-trans isomerase C